MDSSGNVDVSILALHPPLLLLSSFCTLHSQVGRRTFLEIYVYNGRNTQDFTGTRNSAVEKKLHHSKKMGIKDVIS